MIEENSEVERILNGVFLGFEKSDFEGDKLNRRSEYLQKSREEILEWYHKRLIKYEKEIIGNAYKEWQSNEDRKPIETVSDTVSMMSQIFEKFRKIQHEFTFSEEVMTKMSCVSNWPAELITYWFNKRRIESGDIVENPDAANFRSCQCTEARRTPPRDEARPNGATQLRTPKPKPPADVIDRNPRIGGPNEERGRGGLEYPDVDFDAPAPGSVAVKREDIGDGDMAEEERELEDAGYDMGHDFEDVRHEDVKEEMDVEENQVNSDNEENGEDEEKVATDPSLSRRTRTRTVIYQAGLGRKRSNKKKVERVGKGGNLNVEEGTMIDCRFPNCETKYCTPYSIRNGVKPFVTHSLFHTSEFDNFFNCNECGEETISLWSLMTHFKSKHGEITRNGYGTKNLIEKFPNFKQHFTLCFGNQLKL